MQSSNKKTNTRHYPLLTIEGEKVGMNVWFWKGKKYWNFDWCPDHKLEQPFCDQVFRYLCKIDGFSYSLDHAFNDFPDSRLNRKQTIVVSPVWMRGKSLTWDHIEYILESALPHWRHAGKVIKKWLAGKKWDETIPLRMLQELYDEEQERKCHDEFSEWFQKRYRMRKNLQKALRRNQKQAQYIEAN